MNPMYRRLLAAASVLIVGVAGFASAQAVAATLVPQVYTRDQVFALLDEDSRKPPHTGELNGVTFKQKIDSTDNGCASGVEEEATSEEADGSPLNFQSPVLPSGYAAAEEYRVKCDGRLIFLSRVFKGPAGDFAVVRSSGTTTVAMAPSDRVFTRQVGAKSLVLIKGLPAPGVPVNTAIDTWGSWRLILADPTGMTEIRSYGLPLNQGIRIMTELIGR